ncbi:TonB-dependent receptor [Bradyrhizobium sp.]|uniref:TonB-dependent receptor n=1 Tax=Bradyrhizobium sp. TaxID=376 RepID=UPI0039E5DB9E
MPSRTARANPDRAAPVVSRAPSAIGAPPVPYYGGQVASGGQLGVLGNRSVLDTPFNQTSYTAQLIENQQSRTIGDVLDNDPSIRRASPASGLYEYFNIRGFIVKSSDIAWNGLYGLVPLYGSIPVDFFERVEVLKGPSAFLNGMSPSGAVGGAINLVAKRATDAPTTRVTTGLDSDTLWNTHFDVGRRYGEKGEWGIRVNGTLQNGDTSIDGQSKAFSGNGSVALDYRGDRLRLAVDAYSLQDRNRGGVSLAVSTADGLTSMPAAPKGSTNAVPWINYDANTKAAMFSGEYDLNDFLTVYGKVGGFDYDFRGYQSSSVFNLQANGTGSAVVMNNPYDYSGTSSEVGLRSKFNTGPISHNLVLSASRLDNETKSAFAFNVTTINIYNPVFTGTLPAAPANPLKTSSTQLEGVAIADTLGFINDRVLLTLGIRHQDVAAQNFNTSGATTASYDKSAASPFVGLVVKPVENLSLYGNYIEGLSQGTIVAGAYNNVGQVFAPYQTKQIEFGAKLETGHITNTISFFQIEKPFTVADYTTTPLPTLRVDGEQRNRGIEWNVFGEISPGLRALGGVTYLDGILAKTERGAQDGNAAPGAAPWSANIGLEYDTPWVRGFTVTGRVITTSAQYLDAANTIKLPSWTRFDLGGRYVTRLGQTPVTVRAQIRNLFGAQYWEGVAASGTATLGAPRVYMISATADF